MDDVDALHDYGLKRGVSGISGDAGNGVNYRLALDHLAEDGVRAGEMRSWYRRDKELTAVGVGAGVSHSQHAGGVEEQLAGDFILESVARAASAGASWIAALDHEILNDPVENEPVIETLPCQEHEVINRYGRMVCQQLNSEVAVVGVKVSRVV